MKHPFQYQWPSGSGILDIRNTTCALSDCRIIGPSGWKLDGVTTLNSKSPMASLMTTSVRLLAAFENPRSWFFFSIIRLVTSLSNAIFSKLSQSSISRHIFFRYNSKVARLTTSLFRKGLPCSVIMVMICATFIKSWLSPMAVWWTELYILVWIPAYSFNSRPILQKVGAIIKYFSRACSLSVIPMKPPFIFIFLCSCSMQSRNTHVSGSLCGNYSISAK